VNYRKLGRTGLKVAPICLGGNVFGWTADEATSFRVLDAYLDAGGNFIDTANTYSRFAPGNKGGESETILGRWMQTRGTRDRVVIATKAGGQMGPGPNESGTSRAHLMAAVEASLRRLQTDYIDLYQIHFDSPETPLEETLRTLDDLVRQGKVRYIGASNFLAWRLTKALWVSDKHGYVRFDSLQPLYNLIDRDGFERELLALCRDQEIGVIPYSSLASGFLSGKYRRDHELPTTPRAAGVQRRYLNERGFAVLDAVDAVAAQTGATPAQVAIAWLLHRPAITAPIVSATSTEQLGELLGALDVSLDEAALQRLDAAGAV
jgi:aryl-alcohol dehydrogenase-like predicted oxidoreductase